MVLERYRETKVDRFEGSVVRVIEKEEVARFDVPVQYMVGMALRKRTDDGTHKGRYGTFGVHTVPDTMSQFPSGAHLCDQVDIVLVLVCSVEMNHIQGPPKSYQGSVFVGNRFEVLLLTFGSHHLTRYFTREDFRDNLASHTKPGGFIGGFRDFTEATLTEETLELIMVQELAAKTKVDGSIWTYRRLRDHESGRLG
jgi:hypothetical protein